MKLGEAFIQLGFNVDDTALKGFNDKIDDLESAMFKVSGTAAAALYGIDKFIDAVTRNSIGLRDLSIQTGLSTQGLQEWAIAAHLADTAFSTEQAEAGIKSLQGHLAELHNFGTGALPFSRLLGVDARSLNAFQVLQTLHERMPYLMSHAGEFGGQAGIAGLMQQIGLGDQWLNLLQQQEAQYKKTHEAAQSYMLTGDQQKNLVAMDFAAEQLRMRLELLAQQFGAAFSPEIIGAMQKIPPLLTNFATGLRALEVPLGILVGGVIAFTSPWVPFLVILYDVIAAIEIIGAKLNAKGDNWVKDIAHDFDVLLNSIKAVLNLIPGVKLKTDRVVKTKDQEYDTIHDYMKWFEGLDKTSNVSQDNAFMAPKESISNKNFTIAPATYNVYASHPADGLSATQSHARDAYSKANDFWSNHQ